MSIIISKPNKESYNSFKSFRPIVLLNTVGKLIEKVIGERLQFHAIMNDFIHFIRWSQKMIDYRCRCYFYFIHMGWVKNINTSMLVFDISQFFPSLNHHLLPKSLIKQVLIQKYQSSLVIIL